MIRVKPMIVRKIPDGNYSKKDEKEKSYTYIHLKLPTEKITDDFENIFHNKAEQNLIKPKIELATIKDAQRVSKIYNRSWLTSGVPFSPMTYNKFEILFRDPKCNVFVAKVFGIDAGFIVTYLEGENDEFGIIAGLGIIPRFQRKGIATALALAAWERFLLPNNVKELRCEVYNSNKPSYNFIKSLGFEEYDINVITIE